MICYEIFFIVLKTFQMTESEWQNIKIIYKKYIKIIKLLSSANTYHLKTNPLKSIVILAFLFASNLTVQMPFTCAFACLLPVHLHATYFCIYNLPVHSIQFTFAFNKSFNAQAIFQSIFSCVFCVYVLLLYILTGFWLFLNLNFSYSK